MQGGCYFHTHLRREILQAGLRHVNQSSGGLSFYSPQLALPARDPLRQHLICVPAFFFKICMDEIELGDNGPEGIFLKGRGAYRARIRRYQSAYRVPSRAVACDLE